MSIYPTLMDLCGLPTPEHVQGKCIRALLTNPRAPWDPPAVTTYRRNNHTLRTETWRYTRYSDGGEELYEETRDLYEWANLAARAESASTKSELGKWLPKENQPPARADDASDGAGRAGKKAAKAKKKADSKQ